MSGHPIHSAKMSTSKGTYTTEADPHSTEESKSIESSYRNLNIKKLSRHSNPDLSIDIPKTVLKAKRMEFRIFTSFHPRCRCKIFGADIKKDLMPNRHLTEHRVCIFTQSVHFYTQCIWLNM